jgi:hypothetical protein
MGAVATPVTDDAFGRTVADLVARSERDTDTTVSAFEGSRSQTSQKRPWHATDTLPLEIAHLPAEPNRRSWWASWRQVVSHPKLLRLRVEVDRKCGEEP